MTRTFVWIILVFLLAGCVWVLIINDQENRIEQKIESIDGEVVTIEHRALSKGPFWYADKGSNVYKVVYIQDDKEKIGWVKFGIFFPKYKLDYKK